eukprot:Blabericola_migrator_1__1772@NODE_147_length_12949_cov_102_817264_g128_i0_p1_GENE_NODE_147_length_12949_cov_102_817264_g128_i0NODE_147_length_12949_cov_102_817264_g128_i0_p1_ORF_typecomplete_len1372_score302_65Cnd1/PF12717_7/17Cnd1/PF12717_7/9_4e03Cnd1/PF12717_7/0_76NippedB_C/PF12830_7/2_2e02NippedB_C/PF12830_7/1_1_NODE_147_length_12949_cov_102_817264_g128_i018886003
MGERSVGGVRCTEQWCYCVPMYCQQRPFFQCHHDPVGLLTQPHTPHTPSSSHTLSQNYWIILSYILSQPPGTDGPILLSVLAMCAAMSAQSPSPSSSASSSSSEAPPPKATRATRADGDVRPVRRGRAKKSAVSQEAPLRSKKRNRPERDPTRAKLESVRVKREAPTVDSQRPIVGVTYEDCSRELVGLTFGLSECWLRQGRFNELAHLSPVPEVQRQTGFKIWALALQKQGYLKTLEELMNLLIKVVGAKLMASLVNNVQVKVAESIIETLVSLIVCVPEKILTRVNNELRSFFEELYKNTRLKFTTRKALLVNLNRIVVSILEVQKDQDLLWSALSPEKKQTFSSSKAPLEPLVTPSIQTETSNHRSSTLATHTCRMARRQDNTQDRMSEHSDLSVFLLWVAQLSLSTSLKVQTIRLEAWRNVGLVLFALPFKSRTYRMLLERLMCQLAEEDYVPIRALLLEIFKTLFFSGDVVALASSWSVPPDPVVLVTETTDPSLSEISQGSSEGGELDIVNWPLQFQWVGVLVSVLAFADRRRLTIRSEDGSDKNLVECCLPSQGPENDEVIQQLIMRLIDFFGFTKGIQSSSAATYFQRATLRLVSVLGKSSPRTLLQIIPFALPYVLAPPQTQADAQLVSQICPLLETAVTLDPGILGSITFVKKQLQPALLHLVKVKGPLCSLATRLLMVVVKHVSKDYRSILVPLVAKDLNLLNKALKQYRDVKATCVDCSDKEYVEELIDTPLFHDNNSEKLRHSFTKIAAILEIVDLPQIIEDGYLSLEEVRGWFSDSIASSELTFQKSNVIPIIIYDLFCDVYLEYQDLKAHDGPVRNKQLVSLEQKLMVSVLLVLGNLVKVYRDLVRSSRLSLVFSDALQSNNVMLINQAITSISGLFKSIPSGQLGGSERGVAHQPSRNITPTSVAAGGTARSLQPLAVHFPVVCRLLKTLEVGCTIPVYGGETYPAVLPDSNRLAWNCRLAALELLHELIVQGFVDPSDMFESVSACILLGDPHIEAEAKAVSAEVLLNVPNAAAVLRRKAGGIVMTWFKFALNRLGCTEPYIKRPALIEDIDYRMYSRPVTSWLDRVARTKATYINALLEGLAASIAKVYSLADATPHRVNSNPSPSQVIAEAFEFTKEFVLYTCSLLLSIPLITVSELRVFILNVQFLGSLYSSSTHVGFFDEANPSDAYEPLCQTTTTEEDEVETMCEYLHKALARRVIFTGIALLLRVLKEAYQIDESLTELLQKSKSKEADTRTFVFLEDDIPSSQAIPTSPNTMTPNKSKPIQVKYADLAFPQDDYVSHIKGLSDILHQYNITKTGDIAPALLNEVRMKVDDLEANLTLEKVITDPQSNTALVSLSTNGSQDPPDSPGL